MTDIPNPDTGTEEETEELTPEPTPTPNPEPASTPAAPAPGPDYETKFKESARENEVLRAKLAETEARNKPLTTNPTEQELRELHPDWESYLPSEQKILRENLTLRKTVEQNSRQVAEMRAEQAWQKDLSTALKDFPALKGREAEFETFALKPTHPRDSDSAVHTRRNSP